MIEIEKKYIFEYYPYQFHKDIKLDSEEEKNQKFILDLKNYPETNDKLLNWQKENDIRRKKNNIEEAANTIYKLIKYKEKVDSSEVVLFVVPSSKVNNKYHGITLVVKELLELDNNFISGLETLIRTSNVDAAHLNGDRKKEVHEQSIKMINNQSMQGKIFILIDDIITTGTTSDVCIEKMKDINPKKIIFYALGKTCYKEKELTIKYL